MNDEYISREAAKDIFNRESHYLCDDNFGIVIRAENLIDAIPAADVAPVRHGKWKLNADGSGTCSECGRVQTNCWDLDNWDNFCHQCGADMREVDNED